MSSVELLKSMFQAAVDAALPSICVPAPSAAAAEGPHRHHRRRQGVRRHGQGARGCLGGTARGPGRDPLRLSRADGAPRSGGGRSPGPRCRRPRCREAHLRPRAGTDQGRPRALPHLRRRLGAARTSRRRREPRGQAGGEQGAAQVRRHHQRDEHRAEASLGHQGRQARRCRVPRQGDRADDLRRSRRRSFDHRLGAYGARSLHQQGRARHHREIQDRRACERAQAAQDRRRDAEARRFPACSPSRTS